MSLTNSAARARVQSLYGSTIAGHLHGADRLAIATFHSDPNDYVRFQPNDESLPRFRIPASEFPKTEWHHKKMKDKWQSAVTVEPHDWPLQKKLPSAKFSPSLATQFQIKTKPETSCDFPRGNGAFLSELDNDLAGEPRIGRSEKGNDSARENAPPLHTASSTKVDDSSALVAAASKQNSKQKKTKQSNPHDSDDAVQRNTVNPTRRRNPDSDLERNRFAWSANTDATTTVVEQKFASKADKVVSAGRSKYEQPLQPSIALRQSKPSINQMLVENRISGAGKARASHHHSVVLGNDLRIQHDSVRLASSEDDSRRQRSDPAAARSALVPRGSYVCYRCNIPGHFFDDCPSASSKSPNWRSVSVSKEAISQSSVRSRRRRFIDDCNDSATENSVRSLRFEISGKDARSSTHQSKPQSQPKPAFYNEYWTDEEVSSGIAGNTVVEGVLHVDAKRFNAYLRRTDSRDIKIAGLKDCNRAYDGDTVYVRIIPSQEISSNQERSDVDDRQQIDLVLTVDEVAVPIPTMPTTLDSLTAKLDAIVLNEEPEADKEDKPRAFGEVVAIKSRAKEATVDIIGYLKLLVRRDKKQESVDDEDTINSKSFAIPNTLISPVPSDVIMFQPISKRIPRGYIQNSLWPQDLTASDPELVRMAWNGIYSASYRSWTTYQRSPRVASLDLIGSAGHVEPETKALLRASKISHSEVFSPEVLECLQEFGRLRSQKSTIPLQILSDRRDYRNARIFTIDPSTAKDLDDALSIQKISDDIFEIGVHIADVSYFLKEGSALDLEARKRCTSVYLVQKVIPMLPPLLCEELCSLNPGVDRLCFSVVWRMDRFGNICSMSEPWFGRTVIRSCAKLDYRTAQGLVDEDQDIKVDIFGNHTLEEIANDCKTMMEIAMARRANRFENGSLKLDRPRMHFQFDENFNPVSVAAYELHDTNRMIEEYMLLANMLVAEKLANDVPDVAFLRRHVPPVLSKLNEILEVCSKLGYKIDGRSAKTLHKTLMEIEEEDVRAFISVLLTVAMRRAEYLCMNSMSCDSNELSEEGCAHYALGFESYTHFTSPIRRYADVVVHRMLEHCLARDSDTSKIKKLPDPQDVSKMAERCNEMKNRAREAQDMSLLMYLAVLVKKQSLVETAYIMDLGVKAVCVYVPRLGLEDRVQIERIPNIKRAVIKKLSHSELKFLDLEWEDGRTQQRGMFEPVCVQVGVSSHVPYIVQLTVLPPPDSAE